MKRLAVFVATTSGPVRIERITRERAPQSMVCLKRTSTILPISAGYDSFVRPGSGVIEKTFGPFEDGAFRLDVSDAIDGGESWQLGVLIAHALRAQAPLSSLEEAEAIVWVTGQVDCDLAVNPVGHLAEKLYASRAVITGWIAAGRKVTMLVPDGSDAAEAVAEGVPKGAHFISVGTVAEAFHAVGLPEPGMAVPPRPKKLPVWIAAAFAVLTVASVSLFSQSRDAEPVVTAPVERMEALALAPAPVVIEEPVTTPVPPVLEVVEVVPPTPKVVILERRAPAGHTCAEVHFGSVEALKVPVTGTDSVLQGLCGLSLAVDNGDRAHFVALVVDVLSGKLLYGTTKPDLLAGEEAFDGREEWSIDLPRRLSQPFEIRVAAISSDKAVGDKAQWFDAQADALSAARELSADGLATAMLHHRVTP